MPRQMVVAGKLEMKMQKSNLAGSALILVAALMGAAAYAQDVMPEKGMGMGSDMGAHMGMDFTLLDADKDGKVTKAEVDAARLARVKAVDANADGKLSADELAAMHINAMNARMTERAAEMVAKLDTDGDNLLSAAEMAARPGPEMMFDKIDADGDGAITQAEADAAKQAMQEHRGKGKGHGKHGKHGSGFWGMGGDDAGDDQDN